MRVEVEVRQHLLLGELDHLARVARLQVLVRLDDGEHLVGGALDERIGSLLREASTGTRAARKAISLRYMTVFLSME
jgi:hypothetical protein